MIDYRKWKKGNPKVTSLQLDPLNPRIPKGRGILDQRGLIAELVEHDKVYELAKSIVADGYYPLEHLIAVESDGKAVVVEGNRRLASLKLLINPELAPDEKAAKSFRMLSNKIALDAIDKVATIYAPSREAAAPLIMQKHTRQQVERWSTLMQASFYKSLAESGQSLEALAEEYGRPPSEIAGFLRTDTMYAIACSLDYPEDIATIVRDPRVFPAAVLQRLLETPKTREFLGIEFRDQVELVGKVDAKEFKKAYARIVTDIANGDVDTRTLNTVDDVEEYLRGLAPVKPKKPTATKKFNSDAFDISVPDIVKGKGPKASPKKAARTSRPSQTMIPAGVRCNWKNQRIVDIFNELRRLRMDTHPNACAVLLRILLELTTSEYLEATGGITPLLTAAAKKGRPKDWYPTLRQMLAQLMKDTAVNGAMKTMARKRVNRLIAAQDSVLSLDDMDGYVHSAYMHPTQRELTGLWQALEGLFEVILTPPPSPPKK